MSADNWTECPRCFKRKESELEKVRKLYGKVSQQEYENKLAAARLVGEPLTAESLREDYEIGIYDGKFRVDYGAVCCGDSGRPENGCGFRFTFKHEEPIK